MKLIRKPFKGSSAYEIQILSVVVQVPFKSHRNNVCYGGRRVHVWRDPYWRV